MRADRLLALVLLLQARGRVTAEAIAAELEVSVRTVYRDLGALTAAGVPVLTEPGPGGGCRLMADYRFPLRGLRPDEAEALLILGVPGVLRELGLDRALDAAQRQIRVTAGSAADGGGAALVHLDMPRWFGGQEEVPCLRDLAEALRSGRRVALGYRAHGDEPRVVEPFGLVNKAGLWYLVACVADRPGLRVFRVARITSARMLAEPVERPAGFDLAAFWRQWSAEFEASRPRLPVTLRASPRPWRPSVRSSARPPGGAGGGASAGSRRLARGDADLRARAGRRGAPGRLRRPGGGPDPALGPGRAGGHGPAYPAALRCGRRLMGKDTDRPRGGLSDARSGQH